MVSLTFVIYVLNNSDNYIKLEITFHCLLPKSVEQVKIEKVNECLFTNHNADRRFMYK